MTFLEAVTEWVLNQDPEDFPDIIDIGDDGLTISDLQAAIIGGVEISEVYDYYSDEPIVRFTLSSGQDYYMEGTLNDINSELW